MFHDYKSAFQSVYKKVVRKGKDILKITQAKVMQYSRSHVHEVSVSEVMSGTAPVLYRLEKSTNLPNVTEEPLYPQPLALKKAKIDDVRSLLKYLTDESKEMYTQLFAACCPEESLVND